MHGVDAVISLADLQSAYAGVCGSGAPWVAVLTCDCSMLLGPQAWHAAKEVSRQIRAASLRELEA